LELSFTALLSANFIFQNYQQALERIKTSSESLALLAAKLGTTSKDYEAYLQSEREYLQGLRIEPIEIVEKAEYMELLTKLFRLQ
jgi:hypothetical protein